ncbi:MAG: hypothetical protein ACMUJM_16825 [bacterium]
MTKQNKSNAIPKKDIIGCMGTIFLFVLCITVPSFAYYKTSPWIAIPASGIVLAGWAYIGPSLFPGLLQGLMGITVVLNSIGWIGISLYAIISGWLADAVHRRFLTAVLILIEVIVFALITVAVKLIKKWRYLKQSNLHLKINQRAQSKEQELSGKRMGGGRNG